MEDNKYNILDLLDAIVDEKPVEIQAVVNQLMIDKAQDVIASLDRDMSPALWRRSRSFR